MEETDKDEKSPKKHELPKVEARLGPLLTLALKAYMQDRHLTNESEILRSALGQLLEREGYLIRIGEEPGEYQVITKPAEGTAPAKKIGFRDSLKAQPILDAAFSVLSRFRSPDGRDGTDKDGTSTGSDDGAHGRDGDGS